MNVFAQPFAIMGIVNVTPDSFYDGGRFASAEKAVEHGLRLVEEGASILDIGGASSRPGAQTVSHEEETRRILPVIAGCAKKTSVPISVDTTRSFVARAAAAEGATWINDISAGRADAGMKQFIAESGCTVVLMHSRGTPQTMQQCTGYGDVVNEVKNELIASATAFCEAGVPKRKIVIDPGIGFAKTAEQNVALLHGCGAFVATGFPVLVGTSRKSFVGHITGRQAENRLAGTLGSVAAAFLRGVRMFRVHDVAATLDFLKVLRAIERYAADRAP
jgi:dihydropteroate synthase